MLWQARKGLIAGRGALDGSAAGSPPLDGLSPTGAWSNSRLLLTSYGAGAIRTTSGGLVTALKDQSGSARDFSAGLVANQPTDTTAGPNSIACCGFDGSNDGFSSGLTLTNFITASSGYWIASIYIDSFPTNSATSYQNSMILGDMGSGWARMTVRSGNILYCFNWDGTEDKATGTVNASTAYVVEWRHEGGNIYQRVNGTGETSVASGNTGNVGSGSFGMGAVSGTFPFAGKIFEAATFSTVPSLADRDALVQRFGLYIGASV